MPRAPGRRTFLLAIPAVLLAACAPLPSPLARVDATERPADFPDRIYREAAAQGRPVLRIDPARSIVVAEVRRGGSLARLGHDHVVASHDVQGYVLPDAGRADLFVRLDRMVVDEPPLRAAAGFDTQPSPEDVAGTRRNMLERVLDAQSYPFARIGVERITTDGERRSADVAITLHGVTRAMRVPMRIAAGRTGLDVDGDLTLAQTSFDIVPLSILGGAVTVQDEVRLRFRLHAEATE